MTERHFDLVFTDHALFEMDRRGITVDEVRNVWENAEQRIPLAPERWVYQLRSKTETGTVRLLRVFFDLRGQARFVVTAYRTSHWERYWMEEA